jgi:hypothetical protein
MARFTSFVVLAEMRTGSNFLEANLNAIPGVACHGELFNPVFVGRANLDAMFGVDLPTRNADPLAMLAAMRAGPGLNGFRLFHDHDPRVTAAVLADPTCAKVVLTRNLAESYVSLLIARETGQWKLTQAKRLKQAKVTFDAAEFTDLAERLQAQQVLILRQLQVTGQTAFWLDYEDIGLLEVMNGLAAYLGVEGRLSAIDSTLKVQNPEPLRDKVTNPEAMEAALARMDRFNLSRTPNFEPRRAAAVPSFVAAGPLLHMPLRGGPDAAVTEWMAGIGPVHGDFNARTLRGWRQAHPQGRSFTVLRDPALRAWGAYGDRVLSGARADVWQAITRDLKLPVPAPGLAFAGSCGL